MPNQEKNSSPDEHPFKCYQEVWPNDPLPADDLQQSNVMVVLRLVPDFVIIHMPFCPVKVGGKRLDRHIRRSCIVPNAKMRGSIHISKGHVIDGYKERAHTDKKKPKAQAHVPTPLNSHALWRCGC